MVQRSARARFMAGVWVFPGGAVDEGDGDPSLVATAASDAAWRQAALRELVEEAGIWVTVNGDFSAPQARGIAVHDAARELQTRLDGDRLGYFANWITPAPLPIRFDTRFYAAVVDVPAVIDDAELVSSTWIFPGEALDRSARGDWVVAYPTEQSLRFLTRFASTSAAMEHIATIDRVPPMQPVIVVIDDRLGMLLPSDDGFTAAAAAELEDGFLERVQHVLDRTGEIPPEQR